MFMRFVLGFRATVVLGGIVPALPLPALATTAADLCPVGTGPCVVSRSITVDDNSIIDVGARHLVIASRGLLVVNSGTMTLISDRLTVESGGTLRALGSGTESGGSITANANVIAVVGRVEAAGAPGGSIALSSTGDLTVTGAIDASSRSREEDGGSVSLRGGTVTLAGPVTANGGQEGFGGEIDVIAGGDLLISRNVEASGGDGGAIDLTAGNAASGNLTISQSGRLQADVLNEDGFGDLITLEANGDGVATGHIIMNGLIRSSGLAGGGAGDIDISISGDMSGTDTSAHLIAAGGGAEGDGGGISVTSSQGQFDCVASIEVDGKGAGGSLDIDVAGNIILTTPIEARGGTRGGSISFRAGGDVTVDTILRTDGGMAGGALTELEGCTLEITATAVLSSTGPNGVNRLRGREISVVRGAMLADAQSGRNELIYGDSRRRPVVFDSAQVTPPAIEILDGRLLPCVAVNTRTPTSTPTRGPRTPTVTPTAPAITCVGDCDGNGSVVVNEIVLGVNIALLSQPVTACRAFDPNGSNTVSIDELVRAVNNTLRGCTP
jgi:hypothetical protein